MSERLDKSEYLNALMVGRIYDVRLLDVCFKYWHSGIPLSKAREYLNTYENKLTDKANRRLKRRGEMPHAYPRKKS